MFFDIISSVSVLLSWWYFSSTICCYRQDQFEYKLSTKATKKVNTYKKKTPPLKTWSRRMYTEFFCANHSYKLGYHVIFFT